MLFLFVYSFMVKSNFVSKFESLLNRTRNATCCNNRDDMLYLSFTLKISIFRRLIITQSASLPSRRYMMELLLRKQYAVKDIHKKAPSKMLALVLNTPPLFEDSSNVLFLQSILHYNTLKISYFVKVLYLSIAIQIAVVWFTCFLYVFHEVNFC